MSHYKSVACYRTLLFQGDSGGPLQLVNKYGRYEIIGMLILNYNLKVA